MTTLLKSKFPPNRARGVLDRSNGITPTPCKCVHNLVLELLLTKRITNINREHSSDRFFPLNFCVKNSVSRTARARERRGISEGHGRYTSASEYVGRKPSGIINSYSPRRRGIFLEETREETSVGSDPGSCSDHDNVGIRRRFG